MPDYRTTTIQELLQNSKIPLEVLDTEDDLYHDMARLMFDEVARNNALGKPTVFIVPVGPVFQYRRFVRLANLYGLDCSQVHLFNMDEYMTSAHELIDKSHPLSFRAWMDAELYDKLQGVSQIPPANRHFPMPGREGDIEREIARLGGVDIAFGGIGICGHIAFNEPPEDGDPISDEEFANLPTRVLTLTRETLTINSVTGMGGYIDGIPRWCITIGMRELLAARKLRFYLNRDWQRGIVRKICLGGVTKKTPASFLQKHPDAKLTISALVASPPLGTIR